MSRVFVCGLGAVSPAGWNVAALRAALNKGAPLPIQPLDRPGWEKPLRTRLVPAPAPKPAFVSHPRLRRTTAITHYVAAAAQEASNRVRDGEDKGRRIGLVVCLYSGCVSYTHRFFDETLKDPATASPMLFPETVFAAPASHLAVLLQNIQPVCTLMGDPASFLQGLALGAQWLESDRVDACLVVGAEEVNWVLADALWHLEHSAIITGGAGALCLSLDPTLSLGVELKAITEPRSFVGASRNRTRAAQAMRLQLPANPPDDLLCDGIGNSPRADAPELAVWRDWPGPRLSPKIILGEGLMAASAWQCVAACDALAEGRFPAANVSVVGCNQQAVGARFARLATSGSSNVTAG